MDLKKERDGGERREGVERKIYSFSYRKYIKVIGYIFLTFYGCVLSKMLGVNKRGLAYPPFNLQPLNLQPMSPLVPHPTHYLIGS